MEFLNIFNQISILFLIMGIGFVACKVKFISEETNIGLSKILLNVTLPFLIISAFNFEFSSEKLKTAGIIILLSILIHGGLVIVSKFLYRNQEDGVRKVLRYITIFSNCGFIGYPVAGSIYGSEGMFYAAVYNVGYNLFMWTIGVSIFQKVKGKELYKKAIINPGIIAVTIGLVLFVFSIKLPYPISQTIKLVGDMTIPLSMIIVGASLCNINIKEAFKGLIYYYATFIRLIVIPLAVYFILNLIGLKGMTIGVPLIVSAMPAAANTVTFAQIYGGDVDCASKITVVTTLFSAITLPVVLLLT